MKEKTKKWFRIFLYITIPVIILILSANSIARVTIEKKLRSLLKQYEPYVTTKFSHIHIDLFSGKLQINSVYILYNPLNSPHIHSVYFSSIGFNEIQFFKLLSKKYLVANTLELNNGIINLDSHLLKKDTGFVTKSPRLPFDSISLNSIALNDIKITSAIKRDTMLQLSGDFSLRNIHIKNIGNGFSTKAIQYGHVQCDINNIQYHLNDFYSIRIKKFLLNSRDSLLEIKSIHLIPLVGKYEMGNKLGYQADHISATIASVKCSGLNIDSMVHKKITAEDLTISNVELYAFRDRRLPRQVKTQPMPLEYLKQIPAEVHISKFNLEDATATSEEFPKKGNQTGFIKIAHIYMHMQPLINHFSKNSSAHIISNVKASIMNAGVIRADINLSTQTGANEINGAIENLNLPALNPSAENLGMFHIQSGVLNKLDFHFTADDKKASGEIIGVYHDLKIDRLKITEHGKKVAWLPSFALHHFIIPKNKDASLPVKKRTGKIDYERDPTRMITFYYLKALLSGIRDSFSLGFLLPE